ncbi:MAG: [FeFe] hydrogenase H-cluster radical SAM maturase HydE [Firmicutes bacterium]|nr:[FeFe] hydrogenase H-cluster radical SAM maturase HydE [Bacillota bacterium]
MSEFEILINVLENKHELDRTGLVKLLTCDDVVPVYTAADRVRKKFVGDDVHLRGLIEFSSYCCRTCFYCGLRAANNKIRRFRMEPGEIIECARHAANCGLKTIVLQSGEDKSFAVNELCKIVSEIKGMDVAVTLSIGELSKDEYATLRKAGADRYLLRIETSNEQLYERLHPGMSYKNRVRCLYDLKDLGYETGTGCLIGLPGQTPEMLADDLLFFKRLDADMIGMGPFIPCKIN